MRVRHVVLQGSNRFIGEKLAEIARSDGYRLEPSGDHRRNRLRRDYLRVNDPIHHERMRGAADLFGVDLEDDAYDLSGLPQPALLGPGCSVVFYPGSFTESGHDLLCRNYDFTTGALSGARPSPDEPALMAHPYVLELHPDEGHASLSICAFDLLGGVLEGINAAGLCVAVLGDDESRTLLGSHPSDGIGVHELQCMRHLLDHCAGVEEAKDALLSLKHYYTFMPCHYIVADSSGKSFVFELAPVGHAEHIVEGNGPQPVTNHPLFKYESPDDLPDDVPIDSYDRFRTLHESIAGRNRFKEAGIRAINASVANTGLAFDRPGEPYNRTLWFALYDLDERTLRVRFYLGETGEPGHGDPSRLRYSEENELRLSH
jgi:hypothetical protein